MVPKNPGIAQKKYPKIQEQPQKGTQNNGTSPYQDICGIEYLQIRRENEIYQWKICKIVNHWL